MMKKEIIDMLEKATYEDLLEIRNSADTLIKKKEEVINKLKNNANTITSISSNSQTSQSTKEEKEKFNPSTFVCSTCGNVGIHELYKGFDDFDDENTDFTIYKCNNKACEQEYQLYVSFCPYTSEYDMPVPYESKNCKKSKGKKGWIW